MLKFTDVPETHWAYEAINKFAELGIIEGYEDGTFHPDEPLTRAEAVALLNRIEERL